MIALLVRVLLVLNFFLWPIFLFVIGPYRKGINIPMGLSSKSNRITCPPSLPHPPVVHFMIRLVQTLNLAGTIFFSLKFFSIRNTKISDLFILMLLSNPFFRSHSTSVRHEAGEWLRKNIWLRHACIFHMTLPNVVSAFKLGSFHLESCLNIQICFARIWLWN